MTDAGPRHDVLVGYLHGNDVSASFHQCLLDMIVYDGTAGGGRIASWAQVRCAAINIPDGRNDLCKALLRSEQEWLFMVDADMGFDPFALDQLLSLADPETRPMVGGLCFAQRESLADGKHGFRCFPRPTLLEWVPNPETGIVQFVGRAHYPVNSLIRVGATGGALLLVHRSVIEQMAAAFGEEWFTRTPDAAGNLQGEDIAFCDRARQLEIPLFVHTGIRTTHFKNLWLGEDDFWISFVAPPATERVDVIVPVLSRPQNVRPFMESLRASTGLAQAWFVCDEGDRVELDAVLDADAGVIIYPRDPSGVPGTFAEKVNLAYSFLGDPQRRPVKAPRPWVLLVGDDVRFRPGWLDHAQDVARRYGAHVVGTNDLCNPRVVRGEHATHSLIRRSYVDELGASWDGPGVVCHEGYRHWFVDDEIVTVARQRGVFQSALASQVEHLHPMNGGAPDDDIYRLGSSYAERDRQLWERRLRAHTAVERHLEAVGS